METAEEHPETTEPPAPGPEIFHHYRLSPGEPEGILRQAALQHGDRREQCIQATFVNTTLIAPKSEKDQENSASQRVLPIIEMLETHLKGDFGPARCEPREMDPVGK